MGLIYSANSAVLGNVFVQDLSEMGHLIEFRAKLNISRVHTPAVALRRAKVRDVGLTLAHRWVGS